MDRSEIPNSSHSSVNYKSVFKCILFNAQSLCNKPCDLDYLLCTAKPDLFFVTETWLTRDVTNGMLDRHGAYHIYRADRNSKGGGVAIFCHKSLRSSQINVDTVFSTLEVVNIQVVHGCSVFNFINVYRPPGVDDVSKAYTSVLVKYLQQVCVCDSKLKNIIVGDFNLRDIDWTSGECPCDDINFPFYSVVTELGFIQFVSSATRDSSFKYSILFLLMIH